MTEFKKITLDLLDTNVGQIPGLPANPRQWADSEVRRLAKSMKDTPELAEARGCVVVPFDGRYVILGGNLRREAAESLGWPDIMCAVLPEDTPVAKLKEVVLKDNSSFGSWDLEALRSDWVGGIDWGTDSLADWGIDVTWDTAGPDPTKSAANTTDTAEDDFDVDAAVWAAKEPVVQRGDIWQLGDHRLMCGDATSEDDVKKLMGGRCRPGVHRSSIRN